MNAEVASQDTAMRIRRATAADAEALAEIGARTFFETFAADNTAEDMRLFLESTWRPDLQRAKSRTRVSIRCWRAMSPGRSPDSRSCAWRTRPRVSPCALQWSSNASTSTRPGTARAWRARSCRRPSRQPGRAEHASCGWASGSAMSARRRSIASAAFARSGRRSSSSARIRRPIT